MLNNKFYDSPYFNFVKVKFSDATRTYTYAAHVAYRATKGDYVVVPTGAIEDVFSQDNAYDLLRVVKVVDVVRNMSELGSLEYDLKHIVSKIKGRGYTRILDTKNV